MNGIKSYMKFALAGAAAVAILGLAPATPQAAGGPILLAQASSAGPAASQATDKTSEQRRLEAEQRQKAAEQREKAAKEYRMQREKRLLDRKIGEQQPEAAPRARPEAPMRSAPRGGFGATPIRSKEGAPESP